jgi:chromosome partitioning protein
MKVIAVFNQAGGVGKTTTTRDLAYEAAQLGMRILAVDADPQATLTDYLGVSAATVAHEDTFWNEVADGGTKPKTLETFGLRLGAASRQFTLADQKRIEAKRDDFLLRDALDWFEPEIDAALIDCPPGFVELTYQALGAADEILIPVHCEMKSVNGLASILAKIEEANKKRRLRAKLRIAGVVPTLFEKDNAQHRALLDEVSDFARRQALCPVFPCIPRLRTISNAGAWQKPLRVVRSDFSANEVLCQIAKSVFGEKRKAKAAGGARRAART